MIFYTTMPQELIFSSQEADVSQQRMIDYDGIPLLVELENNEFIVIRNMSSNPNHYLDPRCCPGARIQQSFLL